MIARNHDDKPVFSPFNPEKPWEMPQQIGNFYTWERPWLTSSNKVWVYISHGDFELHAMTYFRARAYLNELARNIANYRETQRRLLTSWLETHHPDKHAMVADPRRNASPVITLQDRPAAPPPWDLPETTAGTPAVAEPAMRTLRAISLWQPWASLFALGLKRIETRHWPTNYRGVLVVHAAQKWTANEKRTAQSPSFAVPLLDHKLNPADLPRGVLLGTVEVIDCQPTEALLRGGLSIEERMYGNFAPERFGWVTINHQPFARPIPWKGAQGFFNVTIPGERAQR
jgi:activating signal cointegrator 1